MSTAELSGRLSMTADAVLAAETVQLTDNIGNLHLLAVNRCRNTLFKCHCYIFAFIWSFFWCASKNKKVLIVRLISWIFKLKTFVAYMPDVTVTAVA